MVIKRVDRKSLLSLLEGTPRLVVGKDGLWKDHDEMEGSFTALREKVNYDADGLDEKQKDSYARIKDKVYL